MEVTKTTDKAKTGSAEDAAPVVKKKDKTISAKVYPEMWAEFTAINRAQGMTNNSALNMLLSEYVRNKRDLIKM